jgi:hypothetical protein
MSQKLVGLQIRAVKAFERAVAERADKEAGQGALEYVGMILVAALIAGGVWAALKGVDVTGKVSDAVNKILGN